jgi:hypothetical protein
MPAGTELIIWNPRAGATGDDRYRWPEELPVYGGTAKSAFVDPALPTLAEVQAANGWNQLVAEIRRRYIYTREPCGGIWSPTNTNNIPYHANQEPQYSPEDVISDAPVLTTDNPNAGYGAVKQITDVLSYSRLYYQAQMITAFESSTFAVSPPQPGSGWLRDRIFELRKALATDKLFLPIQTCNFTNGQVTRYSQGTNGTCAPPGLGTLPPYPPPAPDLFVPPQGAGLNRGGWTQVFPPGGIFYRWYQIGRVYLGLNVPVGWPLTGSSILAFSAYGGGFAGYTYPADMVIARIPFTANPPAFVWGTEIGTFSVPSQGTWFNYAITMPPGSFIAGRQIIGIASRKELNGNVPTIWIPCSAPADYTNHVDVRIQQPAKLYDKLPPYPSLTMYT